MERTIEEEIENLLRRVNAKRQDDALDGVRRRQWAVVHTELETIYARIKTYLSEEEE